MNENPFSKFVLSELCFCYGEFDAINPVCSESCALRLACCLENQQHQASQFVDEFFDYPDHKVIFQ